uniref:Uncharacterized protein n=1 Tax=Oryza punctata TaxID=4537 RepID=A0A0E0KYA1_ORYPU
MKHVERVCGDQFFRMELPIIEQIIAQDAHQLHAGASREKGLSGDSLTFSALAIGTGQFHSSHLLFLGTSQNCTVAAYRTVDEYRCR